MTICFENYENGHFETYNHCGDSVRHPFLSNVFIALVMEFFLIIAI